MFPLLRLVFSLCLFFLFLSVAGFLRQTLPHLVHGRHEETLASLSMNQPTPAEARGRYQERFSSTVFRASTAGTEWNTRTEELSLQQRDTIKQSEVTVVGNGNGYVYLVWRDYRNDEGDIYAQRVDKEGNRLWSIDQRVNTDDSYATQSLPAAAVDGAGNLLVAWVDNRNSSNDIYVHKLNPQGDLLWLEDVRLGEEMASADQSAPVIAISSNGMVFVAWHDNRNGHYDIYAQQMNMDGIQQWAGDVRVNDDNSVAPQTEPAIVADGEGVAFAWLDNRIGNGDLYMQRLSAQGKPLWSQSMRVNQPAESTQNRPAISYSGGLFTLGWQSAGDFHIYAQQVNTQGQLLWQKSQRISQQPASEHASPALITTLSGVIFAWHNVQAQAIFAQLINSAGVPLWSEDQRVIDQDGATTVDLRFATLALISPGMVAFAWADQRYDASGDIFIHLINTAGIRTWLADQRMSDLSGTVSQRVPDLSIGEDGNTTIVWQDRRSGSADLYLQRITPQGQRLWSEQIQVDKGLNRGSGQLIPALINVGNEIIVAWSAEHTWSADQKGVARIHIQRFDAAGNRLWPAARLVDAAPQSTVAQVNPVLAANVAGQIFVAWEELQSGQRQVAVQRMNAAGAPQWTQPARPAGTLTSARLPVIAVSGQDSLLVAWIVVDSGANLYLQRIDGNGASIWPTAVQVNSFSGVVEQFNAPALAADSAGNSTLVWVDRRNSGVYAQRLDGQGLRLWTIDLLLNKTPGTFLSAPVVAGMNDGSVVVAWQDLDQGQFVVKAERILDDGSKTWSEPPSPTLTVSSGSRNALRPRIAVNSQRESTVVWQDERRMNPDVFVQRLNRDGLRLWEDDLNIVPLDRFYQQKGQAQSLPVTRPDENVLQVTLTADFDLHGGNIRFLLTNNGLDWHEVQPGLRHRFETKDSLLQWRVELASSSTNLARSPVIRSLQLDYSSAASFVADLYEPNDSCPEAQPLQVDGAPQHHKILQEAAGAVDEDWVQLSTQQGMSYTVVAMPTAPNLALRLDLVDQCGKNPTMTVTGAAGQSAVLTWHSAGDRLYFVRISPASPVVDSSGNYQISVHKAPPPGFAILVGGHPPENHGDLQRIEQMLGWVEKLLLHQGYGAERILVLGGDGDPVTADAVRSALEAWPASLALEPDAPLYLYLVGWGDEGRFMLSESESISPALLDLWISNLEARLGSRKVVVILEAGKAGSFITPGQSRSSATLAAPNRLIVSATSATGNCWSTAQGTLFGESFWSSVYTGHSIFQSFQRASLAVQDATYGCLQGSWCQQPWLNDGGHMVSSEAGVATTAAPLAHQLAVPPPYGKNSPRVQRAEARWQPSTKEIVVEAHIAAGDLAVQVEGYLLSLYEPPDPPLGGAFLPLPQPVIKLSTVSALSGAGPVTLLYRGSQMVVAPEDAYKVVVNARDSNGWPALPGSVTVYTIHRTYLPRVTHEGAAKNNE